jgi:C-terminal processing protease CtpA/Prc
LNLAVAASGRIGWVVVAALAFTAGAECEGEAVPAAGLAPHRIDRVATLGRIWGYAAYLHPALHDADAAGRWDRAFVDAVPAVLEAENDAIYAQAVDTMLRTLGDAATRVIDAPAPSSAPPQPIDPPRRDVDGVLVVDLRDPATAPGWFEAAAQWRALTDAVAEAKAVVFDLRGAEGGDRDSRARVANAFIDSGVGLALACRGLTGPSLRARAYDGFPPERGGTSGGYRRYFESTAPDRIEGFRQPPAPAGTGRPYAVFVVDAGTVVPDCAAALSLADKGAIVAEGAPGILESMPTLEVELGPGHLARLRLAEAVRADGTVWPGADRVVEGDALARALEIARAGQPLIGARGGATTIPPSPPAPVYPEGHLPALPWRALAVAKTCILIDSFFPYRELMSEDWEAACRAGYDAALAAADAEAFRVAIARLLRATADSHVGLRGPAAPAALGRGLAPLRLRFIEGRPIVVQRLEQAPQEVRIGDELVAIEGRPVAERIERLRGLVTASTPQSRDLLVAGYLLAGEVDTPVRFEIDGASGRREVLATRLASEQVNATPARGGPVYRLIDPHIGYADLARLMPGDVEAMFEAFAASEAIVFDMRGYPNGTAWSIAPHLAGSARIPAARFDRLDVRAVDSASGDVGAMRTSTSFTQYLPDPVAPTWRGRSVMLIDERAISQAEHTGLFLRAANGTRFVGTPTTGANGDVTSFGLPGGLRVTFTGQSVRWPDGTQLQRRGLQPDVAAAATIAGIRAGRDEVLEAALAWLRANPR